MVLEGEMVARIDDEEIAGVLVPAINQKKLSIVIVIVDLVDGGQRYSFHGLGVTAAGDIPTKAQGNNAPWLIRFLLVPGDGVVAVRFENSASKKPVVVSSTPPPQGACLASSQHDNLFTVKMGKEEGDYEAIVKSKANGLGSWNYSLNMIITPSVGAVFQASCDPKIINQ